jgi:hypothetical protein
MLSLYPAFINVWAQVRSQCFLAKAVFKSLLQNFIKKNNLFSSQFWRPKVQDQAAACGEGT